MFGLFKKKDPVCGMKQQEGKGTEKHGKWFCGSSCLEKYEKSMKEGKKEEGCGCCCGH